jgi:hypothetical protein
MIVLGNYGGGSAPCTRGPAAGLAGGPSALDGRKPQAYRRSNMVPPLRDEESARRLARAIASDISIYNEAKIIKGIEDDNLFEILEEQIEEGRTHYNTKVPDELQAKNFFNRAIIDIILKNKAHIKSKIW